MCRSHVRDDVTFDAAYDINRNAPFLSVGKRQNDKTAIKVKPSLLLSTCMVEYLSLLLLTCIVEYTSTLSLLSMCIKEYLGPFCYQNHLELHTSAVLARHIQVPHPPTDCRCRYHVRRTRSVAVTCCPNCSACLQGCDHLYRTVLRVSDVCCAVRIRIQGRGRTL